MKKTSIMALILVLTATLFAGCRNMGGNQGNTTTPVSSSTTKPTAAPTPQLPLPTGNTATTPGGATNPSSNGSMPGDGASGIEGRAVRPSARGPRY